MKKFGDNSKAYPAEMRRQLWPLCCGASIISGFKAVHGLQEEELVKQIESTITEYVPDLQVYANETICPKLTFLTLNAGQWGSEKIRNAVTKAGFKLLFTASPRGSPQYFLARDDSNTLKMEAAA